ncbi:MAG: aminotransferase class V-fold PLP-dependent enzyme, partial [Actinomycetales bacterium]
PVSVGRLLNAAPDLLAFCDSATRAWTQFVTALPWQPGDRVLICGNEYASNAIPLLQLARLSGVVVEVVPTGSDGDPDLAALAAMLDERVRLVSLVHVATNSGHVTRVTEVVALAHAVGALVLLDACQSVGQLALDVEALGVDALSATGRKWLRGPRGTGFLYVRREALVGLEPAAADMRGATWTGERTYELKPDATRFELWENDVAGRLGLKAAVDHLLALDPAAVEAAVRDRAATLRSGLGALPGVRLHDVGADLGGIVSFTVDGHDPYAVRDALGQVGVTVSVSVRTSTRLDMTARGLDAVVRASPHYFVGPDQLDRAVGAVASLG